MAKIWNDIEIEFKGEVHVVRPTLEFINRLEQGPGNSITMLYGRAAMGDLPTGKGCEVIAKTLNYAKEEKARRSTAANPPRVVPVTPEDVLEELTGVGPEFVQSVGSILLACMPEPKKKTNSNAKKKPTAKKSTRKRTGQNSTG